MKWVGNLRHRDLSRRLARTTPRNVSRRVSDVLVNDTRPFFSARTSKNAHSLSSKKSPSSKKSLCFEPFLKAANGP
jgi:hypothetical protein